MDANLQDRLAEAIKTSRADFTDIRVEFIATTSVVYRGGRLEESSTGRDVGGIVRALVDGNWGASSFNRLDDLPARVAEAYDCATAATRPGSVKLAPVDPVVDEVRAAFVRDFRAVSVADKQALVKGYSDLILSQPDIRDARIAFTDRYSDLYYANSQGAFIYQQRPYAALAMSATARESSTSANVQTASDGIACGLDYGLAVGREDVALEVASRAKALLTAEPIKGGLYTVVLSPRMAGLSFEPQLPQATAATTVNTTTVCLTLHLPIELRLLLSRERSAGGFLQPRSRAGYHDRAPRRSGRR